MAWLTVQEVANRFNISLSTVKNWVKFGYFVCDNGTNSISSSSVQTFEKNVLGKLRLDKRANKLYYDTKNKLALQQELLVKLDKIKDDELETIATNYQTKLGYANRNLTGVYYTPASIVRELFKFAPQNPAQATFLDPCCGSGNFLIQAVKSGFCPSKIVGFDIDPLALAIAKTRLYRLIGYKPDKLFEIDFFNRGKVIHLKQQIAISNFDYILTNPPWGSKLLRGTAMANAFKKEFGKVLDSSAIFLALILQNASQNALIGVLVPEAFFYIGSFENIRSSILEKKILSLIDFDKPFKDLMTKAYALIVQNKRATKLDKVLCKGTSFRHERKQSSFNLNPKLTLNFYVTSQENKVLDHIFKFPHIRLKNNALWGLGIVTGNNNKFLKTSPSPNLEKVYRGMDITRYGLSKSNLYINSDISLYQQTASLKLYKTKPKLIYRFIAKELIVFCDTQGRLILNSANFFILKKEMHSLTYVISWLFNEYLLSWIFQKLFNTNKVLRSDLEVLPIFDEFLASRTPKTSHELYNYLQIKKTSNGYTTL